MKFDVYFYFQKLGTKKSPKLKEKISAYLKN
jgi:hypothetical protein